jgi:hypothetical protein
MHLGTYNREKKLIRDVSSKSDKNQNKNVNHSN